MNEIGSGKKSEKEKRLLAGEYGRSVIKRRVEDAAENVSRLRKLGLSRRIAVIVSARQFGLTAEKLTEMLNSK